MFKAGDKVYSYAFGICSVENTGGELYPLKVSLDGCPSITFTKEGKCNLKDKHPSIISLEKAEKMGLVWKNIKHTKRRRVKYYDVNAAEYFATREYYRSKEDFITDDDYPKCNFESFVDEKLNECPPPQETIEWEEIK